MARGKPEIDPKSIVRELQKKTIQHKLSADWVAKHFPKDSMALTYEDLYAHTDQEMRKIFRFLGVDASHDAGCLV